MTDPPSYLTSKHGDCDECPRQRVPIYQITIAGRTTWMCVWCRDHPKTPSKGGMGFLWLWGIDDIGGRAA